MTRCLNVYQFAVYIQEWHLRWKLKLIVMISLSIDMMTSQDHICIQSVTNASQRKEVWKDTNKFVFFGNTGAMLYSYTKCEKYFATQACLRQHMNVHSSKYKCTECGKCFRSKQALTVHRRMHSGEKPFECTLCSKRFTQSEHLVTHSRIHSGEKPHKCPECDKAFSQSTHLTTHMRVHTGDNPYKCSLCDKSFSTSSCLLYTSPSPRD